MPIGVLRHCRSAILPRVESLLSFWSVLRSLEVPVRSYGSDHFPLESCLSSSRPDRASLETPDRSSLSYLLSLGFIDSKCDSSLFIYRRGSHVAYLLLYVDDIILTANTTATLNAIISSLKSEFSMTDLGDLHHFLGINVTCSSDGLFLSQQEYILEILDRAHMLN